MVENISDRKQMEEALRAREEQTRLIIETAHDSFVGMDTEGLITAWNRQAEKTFGWSREEALGRPLSELIIPPRLQAAHREGLRRFLATGETRLLDRPLENVAIHRDGQEFPVELAVWAVGPSESCTFNAFIRDITARKLAEQNLVKLTEELETSRSTLEALNQTLEEKVRERTQKLQAREQDLILSNEELKQRNCQLLEARSQAATDALTSLPNHRAFQERIRAEVSRAATGGFSVGLIMLDIDGFKRFNDSSGHLAGDDLLRRCSRIFVETLGPDCAYRYGGDEFVVILTSADEQQTADVAERLRCAVAAEVGGNGPGLTVSLGVAAFPSTAASVEELIYKADAAMYLAKSAGKNRVATWEEKAGVRSGNSRCAAGVEELAERRTSEQGDRGRIQAAGSAKSGSPVFKAVGQKRTT
jgi:diguanylate cyclase (GGDEF)-like protein/PAS domain S-box-containing protein